MISQATKSNVHATTCIQLTTSFSSLHCLLYPDLLQNWEVIELCEDCHGNGKVSIALCMLPVQMISIQGTERNCYTSINHQTNVQCNLTATHNCTGTLFLNCNTILKVNHHQSFTQSIFSIFTASSTYYIYSVHGYNYVVCGWVMDIKATTCSNAAAFQEHDRGRNSLWINPRSVSHPLVQISLLLP